MIIQIVEHHNPFWIGLVFKTQKEFGSGEDDAYYILEPLPISVGVMPDAIRKSCCKILDVDDAKVESLLLEYTVLRLNFINSN